MSKPIINETISAADPTAVTGSVRLWAQDGGGGTAYTNAGTPITLGGIIRVSFDANGALKADDGTTALQLNPNSGSSDDAIVTPTGTVWQYEIRYPGVRTPEVRYLTIPDTAGPYNVVDVLTDEPASILTAGSKAYTDAVVAALPGLGAIADQRILGNNTGTSAIPTSLTGAQSRSVIKAKFRQDDLLRNAQVALSRATDQTVDICFFGDSIFQRGPGSYMGNNGNVLRVAQRLAATYNTRPAGRGWLPIYTDDSLAGTGTYPYGWNNTGGTSSGNSCAGSYSPNGPGGWARSGSDTASWTHTETCDGIDLYATLQATASAASVTVTLDGVEQGTFSTGSASLSGTNKQAFQSIWSSGQLTYKSHTVVVTVTGSGTAILNGAYFHAGTVSSGVRVWDFGHTGETATAFANALWTYDACTTLTPDLVITDFGTNDYDLYSGVTTTYLTDIASLWSGIASAAPLASRLHVNAYKGQEHSLWSTWRDAAEAAAATASVGFLDLYEILGDLSETQDPLGLSDDGAHPNDKGHDRIAQAILDVIDPKAGLRGAVLRSDGTVKGEGIIWCGSGTSDLDGAAYIAAASGLGAAVGLVSDASDENSLKIGLHNVPGFIPLGLYSAYTTAGTYDTFFRNTAAATWSLANVGSSAFSKITGSADATAARDLMNRQSVDARIGVPDGTTVQVSASVLSIKDAGVTYAKIQNVTNNRILGNVSGSAAAPSELTGAQVGALVTPNNLAAATGAWSLGQNFTATKLTQSTATAANGSIAGETSGTDASNRTLGWALFTDSTYTNATVSLSFLSVSGVVFLNGLYLGDGTDSGQDVSYTRSGANAAKINASSGLTVTGNLTLSAKNIITDTTTGIKIGTATGQKVGFHNSTPTIQWATTGTATGFTAGAGTTVTHLSTFTGNTGSTAYTIGDLVAALKGKGLIAA